MPGAGRGHARSRPLTIRSARAASRQRPPAPLPEAPTTAGRRCRLAAGAINVPASAARKVTAVTYDAYGTTASAETPGTAANAGPQSDPPPHSLWRVVPIGPV